MNKLDVRGDNLVVVDETGTELLTFWYGDFIAPNGETNKMQDLLENTIGMPVTPQVFINGQSYTPEQE